MNNIALILKNYGYKFTAEGNKFVFSDCPICKGNTKAAFNERSFFCTNCMQGKAIPINDFLTRLKIKVDISPTDVKELLEKSIDLLLDPELKGIETGYKKLDHRTGGLLHDHLYVLASETGMGKSVFSTNLLINIAKKGYHTSYFDLENGKLLMLKRFIAIASMKPVSLFDDPDNIGDIIATGESLAGMITFRDQQMLEAYIGNLQGVQIAEAICDLIRSDVKEKKTRVVVIDPLENFETEDKSYNVTGRVVELFKNLAQELHIAIIINHHVKKPDRSSSQRIANVSESTSVSYRIPTISDLTGTSKITNKATDVWAIVRQKDDLDINKKGRMLLCILKSREDRPTETGDLYFGMNLENLKIVEIDLTKGK
ncbi:MAG TPA: DnaB-like helicase C-terminal domain-containing protein [Candidatus Sulfotelmatobacter sp.]|jgi:replicative DNA helicase|nr:DnaB-like helicase C-terminal domain-containing protein [Candidatus Sulfotelmatobacter sp.]